MQYDRKFFKKTGYKVTDEPLFENQSERLIKYFQRFLPESKNPHPGTIQAIRAAIAEFPDQPTLYNYLFTALIFSGQKDKARQLLKEIVVRFPDYAFGKIMLAEQLLSDNKPAEAKRVLGGCTDIREILPPNQEIIHASQFKSYSLVAGKIEAELDNIEKAKGHLRNLLVFEKDSPQTHVLGLFVFQKTVIESMLKMQDNRTKLPHIEHVVPEKYAPITEEPTFQNPETAELLLLPYKEMPERVQQSLLALPRETFVADLCSLLADSIQRIDYYTDDEAEPPGHLFHALAYLAFLKADEALPMVLDTLREGPDYSDFWLGDWSEDLYTWYFVGVAAQNLDALQGFVREGNISWLQKNHVCRAVAQLALHEPALLKVSVQWFADLFQYLIDNASEDQLIDSDFISFAICEATNMHATELIPHIEALDKMGWIDPQIMGDLAEIKIEINNLPDPADIKPMPFNLNDFYSRDFRKRWQESNRPPIKSPFDDKDPVDLLMLSLTGDLISDKKPFDHFEYDDDEDDDEAFFPRSFAKPVEPIRHINPKIGRNDPCPCGSGKKHKRCHGQNE